MVHLFIRENREKHTLNVTSFYKRAQALPKFEERSERTKKTESPLQF